MKGFAFHCHHDVLCEWVTDYAERVEYIKSAKPESEQKLRLRLFRLIPKDQIPAELHEARSAYDKARSAYDKAWAAYLPALIALHKELCPNCPWDGNTIFTEKESK